LRTKSFRKEFSEKSDHLDDHKWLGLQLLLYTFFEDKVNEEKNSMGIKHR